jgi:hypothetical protein
MGDTRFGLPCASHSLCSSTVRSAHRFSFYEKRQHLTIFCSKCAQAHSNFKSYELRRTMTEREIVKITLPRNELNFSIFDSDPFTGHLDENYRIFRYCVRIGGYIHAFLLRLTPFFVAGNRSSSHIRNSWHSAYRSTLEIGALYYFY